MTKCDEIEEINEKGTPSGKYPFTGTKLNLCNIFIIKKKFLLQNIVCFVMGRKM